MAAIQSLVGFTHVSSLTVTAIIFLPLHSKIFLPFVASIQGWDPAGLLPMQFAEFNSCNAERPMLKTGVSPFCERQHADWLGPLSEGTTND